MAKNTNKRIPVKWIRDGAKAAYVKKDKCHICGTTADLELHHLHSITYLLEKWVRENGYDISTDEAVLAIRDEFISAHKFELYDQVYTLCNTHHVKLHGVYGKAPIPGSEPRQERWIGIQKGKYTGETPIPAQSHGSFFSAFI